MQTARTAVQMIYNFARKKPADALLDSLFLCAHGRTHECGGHNWFSDVVTAEKLRMIYHKA